MSDDNLVLLPIKPEVTALDNNIHRFMHCRKCIAEKPNDQSPREYARLEVGMTPVGLQVWCVRHDINIAHIDFEGQKHPAWTEAKVKKAVMNTDEYKAICDNCGETLTEDRLQPIKDAYERLTPGEEVPAGECPDCGGLVYLLDST